MHGILLYLVSVTGRVVQMNVLPVYPVVLTSLLQSHHGGLLYQIFLYEAPEVLAVDAEVW